MTWFPMFTALEGRRVLIVGGGAEAVKKAEKLLPFGPKLTVIAPQISPEFTGVERISRPFRPGDLFPRPAMVIVTEPELGKKISRLCRRRHIPVNVADKPELCSFYFPAIVQRGSFCAGITTGGASPAAAAYYRERVEEILPENLEALLEFMEEKRREIPDRAKRTALFRACLLRGSVPGEEAWAQMLEDTE